MFSVHTTTEEFENGGFILKTHQMFSVHTTTEECENGGFTLKTNPANVSVHTAPEEFENGGFTLKTDQIRDGFWICVWRTRSVREIPQSS